MAEMLQPGDEKENEGCCIDAKASKFGNYRCVFRRADESLYMMMKNSKTKRAFGNTFSKSQLMEMELKQSINKIVNLLEEAQSGSKSELTFKMAFGNAENNKKVTFKQLSKSYAKGDALYIFVAIENSYFGAEYIFKLFEKKQNETDLLRDIIADMQEEIDELKTKKTGVTSWYTNITGAAEIPMVGAHLEPTLEGMVKLSDDKKSIVIGMEGVYKVSAELNFTSNTGAGHTLSIKLNGNIIATKMGSNGGGFGSMNRVLKLKKDDTISFYTNHSYGTNQTYSSFIIQKI
eukprot:1008896_1